MSRTHIIFEPFTHFNAMRNAHHINFVSVKLSQSKEDKRIDQQQQQQKIDVDINIEF